MAEQQETSAIPFHFGSSSKPNHGFSFEAPVSKLPIVFTNKGEQQWNCAAHFTPQNGLQGNLSFAYNHPLSYNMIPMSVQTYAQHERGYFTQTPPPPGLSRSPENLKALRELEILTPQDDHHNYGVDCGCCNLGRLGERVSAYHITNEGQPFLHDHSDGTKTHARAGSQSRFMGFFQGMRKQDNRQEVLYKQYPEPIGAGRVAPKINMNHRNDDAVTTLSLSPHKKDKRVTFALPSLSPEEDEEKYNEHKYNSHQPIKDFEVPKPIGDQLRELGYYPPPHLGVLPPAGWQPFPNHGDAARHAAKHSPLMNVYTSPYGVAQPPARHTPKSLSSMYPPKEERVPPSVRFTGNPFDLEDEKSQPANLESQMEELEILLQKRLALMGFRGPNCDRLCRGVSETYAEIYPYEMSVATFDL